MIWLVAGLAAVTVSGVSLRRRSESALFISRFATLMVLLHAGLDFLVGGLVTRVVFLLPHPPWANGVLGWLSVGAAFPALLRAERLHFKVGRVSVGPSLFYLPLQEEIEEAFANEAAHVRERRSREITSQAMKLGIRPTQVRDRMLDLIRGQPLLSPKDRRRRAGETTGAMKRSNRGEQMKRLVELMYRYRMRSLLKDVRTGRNF